MSMRVTVKLLEQCNACKEQVELFRKTFPRGAALTLPNLRKAEEAGLSLLAFLDLARKSTGRYLFANRYYDVFWKARRSGAGRVEAVWAVVKAMKRAGRKRLG